MFFGELTPSMEGSVFLVVGHGFVEKWLKIFISEINLNYREINSVYRGYIFDYREIMNMHIRKYGLKV